MPTDLRELFAWTVREGVTNVVRHSGAGAARCGSPPPAPRCATTARRRRAGAGAGLLGLRERAAALGATVVTRHLSPGFSLLVVRA